MKIIQILSSLSPGDGVGNDCLAIHRALNEEKIENYIYAEWISPKLPKGIAYSIEEISNLDESDIIIYHLAIGTPLNFKINKFRGKKVLRYHNITPAEFFYGYSNKAKNDCSYGIEGVKYLADKIDYGLVVSEFNKQDLIKLGYKCEIDIMPILIPFTDYDLKVNHSILNRYKDGKTNIIFVGRISPNKCQEDVIRAFYLYKKYYDKDARLFLVGSYNGMEKYYDTLRKYVEELSVEDVYFTGHIPFEDILAYYKIGDIFLCMSEHEGFCIPLVEAMYFKIPIIAFNSSAIKDTMGGKGILLNEKNYLLIAACMNKIRQDYVLREYIIEEQNRHCECFYYGNVKKILMEYIAKIK